jgi:hypothetical protein
MPTLAPLQHRAPPASENSSVQRRAQAQGPLGGLAQSLNARPRVAQLSALAGKLTAASSPVQRVFAIRNGKTYDDGDDVRNNTTLAKYLNKDPNADKITEQAASMADEMKDYGTLSWAEVIKTAREALGLGDDDMADFSSILEDTDDIAEEKHVKKLNRTNSMDFSDMFKKEFGGTTEEARKKSVKMELKSEVEDHEEQMYTTSGRGRFMRFKDSQLGDTKYLDFIPKLKDKVGKSEQVTAQLLLDDLTDVDKYKEKAKTEKVSDKGRLAIEQTSMLFTNEIIHRSSSNLPIIIGVLQSVSKGKTLSMIEGFKRVGMFIPTGKDHSYRVGGQMLSRVHHKGSRGRKLYKEGKFDKKIRKIHKGYRGGINKIAKHQKTDVPGLNKSMSGLNKRFIGNLKKKTTISGLK